MQQFLDDFTAYIAFDERDRARLRDLHDRLAPHFLAIAERFYVAASASPGAAAVLSGPDQLDLLHRTLVDWMSSGLRGPYDVAFYEKRMRIGRRHVQIGLAQRYMFAAMNVVRTAYVEHVAALYPPAEATEVVRAVNKLLDLELAIMLRHYQLDSEDQLVQRERQILADRLAAMRTLSAGLAHEIRNPLNAARLQLELLERRLRRAGHDPDLTEPTRLANHELARLTTLLNDFLSFARPPDLHLGEHDLQELCRQVLELERPLASRRRVDLELAPHPPVIARVDAGKLHQVVQNLIRNGIEATPSGGHVRVEVRGRDRLVRLRIADDGPGIPAEVLPRIYEPFFSTKEGGTGMGMAIVHSLVTMHGGRIEVDTSAGTAFEITLPAG